LARELGVSSKLMLDKCRAEGIELKNHMAALSAGLEATIREWFSESSATTAVETTQHVDLDKAREEARKHRRKSPSAHPSETEGQAPAAEATAVEEEAVVEAAAEPVAEVAVEPVAAVEPPPAPAVDEPPAAPVPAAHPEPVPHAVEGEKHHKHPRHPKPAPPPEPEKPAVRPAGPQVVPAPARLRGPRVVRVEKPDIIAPPPSRTQIAPPPGSKVLPSRRGKIATPATEESEEDAAKKRSPRRRGGGRSADSGDKLHEWRKEDLQERSQRLAAATGASLRRHRAPIAHKGMEAAAPTVRTGKVEVSEPITVKNLSAAMGVKAADIVKKLMAAGTLATVNQVLDLATAESLALEYEVELSIQRQRTAEEEFIEQSQTRQQGEMNTRAPVVTFLGHVDHGKTSLLDRIRGAEIAAGEAGGITQHIGAYRYDKDNVHVVFLDTPGHEAFTAMRARGANMTDVVVLVVAADDGVMPQTIEAISHAKAAGVRIVVAMNKIDMPNANENRVLGQLAEHDLQPREWGGDVEVIRTSAVTGRGIEDLVTTLSLEAELLELKAEPDAPASGFVIEAQMDPGLGVLARMLVRNGTLRVGDVVVAGRSFGRVRQLLDHHGRAITEAGPSTPVQVAGLDELPDAGDKFYVTPDLDVARNIAEDRRIRTRQQELATAPKRSLQDIINKIEAGQATELALIIKADVQGSIEAIVGSLEKLNTEEVRVKVLHAAVGGITAGDVRLAEASNAFVIGFNVVADSSARQLAEQVGIEIRLYRIIYDILDDIRKAMEEGLAPEIRMETLGRAEVRQTFKISRVGTIAGCFVIEGVAQRNAKVRITRGGIVVEDERSLDSLKRFKDDAREVRAGMECGLKIAGYDDIKEGDILEFYQQVEVTRRLGK
jgi:translation initiation factor IF-2